MMHHDKPESMHSRSRSQWRVKMSMFVQWYFVNYQTFCYQTWCCDALSWGGVSCKKIGLLFSRSRSQQGLMWSKYDSLYYIFRTADPLATKLGLMAHHHKLDCLWEDWIALLCSRSRSQERYKIPVNVHLDDISATAEPFVAKLGMVMYHHGPSCVKTGLLSSRSWSHRGLIQSNMTVSIISAELLIFLQPNLIGWCVIVSWSVLCKIWIVVFKTKVTVKVQDLIES